MTYTLPFPVLACGMCIDTQLTGAMPFLFYWLFCLPVWSLVAGPVCLAVAKRKCEIKARNPLLLFPGFVVVWGLGGPILMGAVVAPIILVLPFWITAIVRGVRQSNVVWRRANWVLALILFTCIPVSFAVPVKPFAEYRKSFEKLIDRSQQTDGGTTSGTAPSAVPKASHP